MNARRLDGSTARRLRAVCAVVGLAVTPSSRLAAQAARDSSSAASLFRRGDDRDLRRIVIEFGNSAWADDALLLLAQHAFDAGNAAAALDYAARLRTDYPGSELRARAALWGARAAFESGEPRTACALLDSARVEAAGDVEFINQVSFYRGRCTAAALAPPPPRPARSDSSVVRDTSVGTTPPSSRPAVQPSSQSFEVQVAAPTSGQAARGLATRLARAGLHPRIVDTANVHRVRLGPFATSAAADSAARAARRIVGGSPFVVRLP